MDKSDKVIRIQADRLAETLGLPPMTYFSIQELKQLSDVDLGAREITFRGKTIKFSQMVKSLADLIHSKLSK